MEIKPLRQGKRRFLRIVLAGAIIPLSSSVLKLQIIFFLGCANTFHLTKCNVTVSGLLRNQKKRMRHFVVLRVATTATAFSGQAVEKDFYLRDPPQAKGETFAPLSTHHRRLLNTSELSAPPSPPAARHRSTLLTSQGTAGPSHSRRAHLPPQPMQGPSCREEKAPLWRTERVR